MIARVKNGRLTNRQQAEKEKGKQTAEKVTTIHDISDISDEETDRDGFKDLLNGRESDAEDPEDSDSEETRDTADLLQELEECFGAEEKCGEAVHAKLAEVANNGVRCKLNQDKIKEAGDKYLRPKTGLETYFFRNSQTFASGFNLNSQIAMSNSQVFFQ